MLRNPYRALIALLPDEPLQVGTVTAISNGLATIELPGGGIAQARGSASVGTKVYFRAGLIQGPAPNLPVVEIEI